jgi:ribosomal protein L37E
MTIDFGQAKRKHDDDPNKVKCSRCGEWIFARSTKCPRCGVFFQGEAFQFAHESDELEQARAARKGRVLIIGITLLIAFGVAAALIFTR